MTDRLTSGLPRLLVLVACVVIISWGIKAASELLSLILFGLFLALGTLPLPKWMMHQFKLARSTALALTVALLGTLQLVLIFLLYERAIRIKEKLPIYQERLNALYEHITVFLSAHGIDITRLAITKVSTSDQVVKLADLILPKASHFFSEGLLVVLLAGIFLFKVAEDAEGKGIFHFKMGEAAVRGHVGSTVAQIRSDVALYIGIRAATGALTALANLVLLVALGVDFPLVWCALYFFLHFIPNVGIIIALVPPTCLALLMMGWKKALLVAGGMVLTELLSDYVLTPLFLEKGVNVSFMEIMLSLLWWGFLLGPAGGILAIPLTLALRRFIAGFSKEQELAEVPSG
jgi:AI-2 transport protein TqsA